MATGFVVLASDFTERKRAEDRLKFLVDASEALGKTLDFEAALRSVARLAVPAMADWCAVDLVRPDGAIERLAVSHNGTSESRELERICRRTFALREQAIARVARTGRPVLLRRFPQRLLRIASQENPALQDYRGLRLNSCLMVPMRSGENVFGVITLVSAASRRHYNRADLEFAELLARRAAVAADTARLYKQLAVAHGAARDNEIYFRNLAEAIPHMVWTTLPDGTFEYCNGRWEQYTGQTMDESQGLGWLKAVHPDHVRRVEEAWNRSLATGELFEAEYPLRGADGDFHWHIERALPLRNEDGNIIKWFGTCTDIHEKKQAEQMIRKMNKELERRVSERTSALQEINDQMEAFCYSVSHDLRAPLRAMRAFTQVLLEDYSPALDDAGKDYLNRVGASAERMDRLIQDLLHYSRLGRMELNLAPTSTDRLVESVLVDLAQEISQKQAAIQVQKPLPDVIAQETVLEQVLQNLISNALKFSRPDVPPLIRIWSETREGRVRISVQDNGIGIPPQHHQRIFRVFERLHGLDRYPGTGIGLAIVQKGIERMRGVVGIASEPGKGSCFWFELPAV